MRRNNYADSRTEHKRLLHEFFIAGNTLNLFVAQIKNMANILLDILTKSVCIYYTN